MTFINICFCWFTYSAVTMSCQLDYFYQCLSLTKKYLLYQVILIIAIM